MTHSEAFPLIMFDCDGVLVDTEAASNDYIAALFSNMGWQLSGKESRKLFQGKSMDYVAEVASAEIGTPLTGDDLQQKLTAKLQKGVKAITGVEDTVEQLFLGGYPICVASSGSVEKMHTTLAQTRLFAYLQDLLFSTTMVENGKPAPDIYLYAASEMGYDIKKAIIIEDSPAGVEAGIAAGATVLGYCADPFISAAELKKLGAKTFTDMRQLPALIQSLL